MDTPTILGQVELSIGGTLRVQRAHDGGRFLWLSINHPQQGMAGIYLSPIEVEHLCKQMLDAIK